MDILVLDNNLNAVDIIDTYESLIWTERYNKYGDFELYAVVSDDILQLMKSDYYLETIDSEHVMIIEDMVIKADVEDGNHITITGRSLESILDRRLIWGYASLSGSLQDGIEKLLNDAIINPTNTDRKIENFIFKASDDPVITGLTLTAQFPAGESLYEVISSICIEYGIGFKITLNDYRQFVFELYAGADRSYDQVANPYVVFSPNFENLSNSNYAKTKSGYKNVTLVGGEGEGLDRRYTSAGSGSGLNRREVFTDASGTTSDVGDGTQITDEQYMAILQQKGEEALATQTVTTSFEGEAETTVLFKYGIDFFMGDILQIQNEYGHESTARVTELVTSHNEEGLSVYPTFENLKEGE